MNDHLYWLSWWEFADDWRPVGPEWPPPPPILAYWCSGYRGSDDAASVVALVRADSEAAAWAAVRAPHCWPAAGEERFCHTVTDEPGARFPCPEWAADRWPWSTT